MAQEELATVTNDIAGATGGEAKIPPNLKGRPRAEEKLAADYGGDVSRLTDLARTSIIYENIQDVYRGLEQIQGQFEITKLKDRFSNPTDQGYRDILLNVRMSNGHVVEIQLHMRQIIEVKGGVGHKIYEEIRTIQARAVAERRALTPDELARIEQLNAQSRAAYDSALGDGGSGLSTDPGPTDGLSPSSGTFASDS
ncbi:MAG: RelA/SpoT domain-containing protein [Bradymonadia bacterium]